jgi:hypothetical protein
MLGYALDAGSLTYKKYSMTSVPDAECAGGATSGISAVFQQDSRQVRALATGYSTKATSRSPPT